MAVERVLDQVNAVLVGVWETRAAPDDVIAFHTSLDVQRDEDTGEIDTYISVYLSIKVPEQGPYAASTCYLAFPVSAYYQPGCLDHMAHRIWDQLASARLLSLEDGVDSSTE